MEESNRYCKVCVTGGSGFIGSRLIKMLLNKGIYYVHATLRNLDIEFHYKTLKELDDLCGKIPIIHLEDACEARIFCIENDSIKGRFLCAGDYVSAAEIAECLQQTHPELNVKPMYMEGPKRTVKWGSTKLIDQGFEYKHDMKMILDDSVKILEKIRWIIVDSIVDAVGEIE